MQPAEQRNIDELAHEVRGMEAGKIQRLSFRAFLGLNTPKQARLGGSCVVAILGGLRRLGRLWWKAGKLAQFYSIEHTKTK